MELRGGKTNVITVALYEVVSNIYMNLEDFCDKDKTLYCVFITNGYVHKAGMSAHCTCLGVHHCETGLLHDIKEIFIGL